MVKRSLLLTLMLVGLLVVASGTVSAAPKAPSAPTATLLAAPVGMTVGSGSTVGPDGALYVTDPVGGRVLRIDPGTGSVKTFADGLPRLIPAVGIGGAMDVAFIDKTAYVLVTLVSPDVGGQDVDGIYRIDGKHSFKVVADIGSWAAAHLPPKEIEIDVLSGVQYAMQPYHGGFLVTDGHHNRVYWVGLDGQITQLIQFGDIVPTGLALWGNKIYMAEAGPLQHLPDTGKIVEFDTKTLNPVEVARGARLNVDAEFGPGRLLYGLSQGIHDPTNTVPGTPAEPDTGALMRANSDGTFTTIIYGLNQPTSLEFIGNTAYVVSFTGQIWKINNIPVPGHVKH